MTDFRHVTDDFAVSPQITPDEVALAAAQGFTLIINNRPDGEAPDQPTSAQISSAAGTAGLGYAHIPVVGRPPPAQVRAGHEAVAPATRAAVAPRRLGPRP